MRAALKQRESRSREADFATEPNAIARSGTATQHRACGLTQQRRRERQLVTPGKITTDDRRSHHSGRSRLSGRHSIERRVIDRGRENERRQCGKRMRPHGGEITRSRHEASEADVVPRNPWHQEVCALDLCIDGPHEVRSEDRCVITNSHVNARGEDREFCSQLRDARSLAHKTAGGTRESSTRWALADGNLTMKRVPFG